MIIFVAIFQPILHSDVLHTDEISDHDIPYAILNVKKERYERRYKYIRSEKDIDINSYVSDFRELPLNLVYVFDEPDEQVTILNKLILDCIEKHAPIKRIRLTRPVAPWMKDESIVNLKTQNITDTKQELLEKRTIGKIIKSLEINSKRP